MVCILYFSCLVEVVFRGYPALFLKVWFFLGESVVEVSFLGGNVFLYGSNVFNAKYGLNGGKCHVPIVSLVV
jgi:hypothetical protein